MLGFYFLFCVLSLLFLLLCQFYLSMSNILLSLHTLTPLVMHLEGQDFYPTIRR